MSKQTRLEITPAQRPQYVATPDLSPTRAEPGFYEQRNNDARVGIEHNDHRQANLAGLPFSVSDAAETGRRLVDFSDIR